MRNLHLSVILFPSLAILAAGAQAGAIGRTDPATPADASMREIASAPQAGQLSAEENAVIAEKYASATVRPSGLRFIIRTPGAGDATPHSGQEVTVHYEGRILLDGRKFDSSYDHHKPFTFMAGVGRVIPGWDAMIVEMKRGEKRTVIIPWWLGYGVRGAPPVIPSKASLVFDIELLDFH